MPKKIVVQGAVLALLKSLEKDCCKFLPSKAEEANPIKDIFVAPAAMSGIVILLI